MGAELPGAPERPFKDLSHFPVLQGYCSAAEPGSQLTGLHALPGVTKMLLSNWDIPAGLGSSFWFTGVSGLESFGEHQTWSSSTAGCSWTLDFIALVPKMGPRSPALDGSGNQT